MKYWDSYFTERYGAVTFIQSNSCNRPFLGNHNADVALSESEFDTPELSYSVGGFDIRLKCIVKIANSVVCQDKPVKLPFPTDITVYSWLLHQVYTKPPSCHYQTCTTS